MGVRPRSHARRIRSHALLVLAAVLAAGAAAGCGGESGTCGDPAGRRRRLAEGRRLHQHRLPGRAGHARPGDQLGRRRVDRRGLHLQRPLPLRAQAGRRGHGTHPGPRRRHAGDLRGRHDVHHQAASRREVRAAGGPGGHGGGRQVQLRAHDDRAALPGHLLLRGRRRRVRRPWTARRRRSAASRSSTRRPSSSSSTSPDLSFLYALSMEFCDVVPKEWVAKWGKDVNRHPLGTGPFYMTSWTTGAEIKLRQEPQLLERRQGVPGRRGLHLQPHAVERPAQAAARRGGHPRRQHPAGRRRAGHQRPAVEALRVLAAAHRHDVPVHEQDQEAVRRRQGAAGAELGDRPRQAGQAAERPGRVALYQIYPREPARQRAGQGLLRLRPGQGQGAAGRGRLPGRLQDA